MNKRWNQAKFEYFDLYLNRAYGNGEDILIEKEVYYKNIILFI